jgi:hypothetical protein
MYVSPQSGRATITNFGGQVSIRIPTAKNIFAILFLILWLGGWFFGETTVISSLLNGKMRGGNFFILVWLCGWTLGGGWAILTLLWSIAGSEQITVVQGMLKIEKNIAGIGFSREYSIEEIRDIRFENNINVTAGNRRNIGVFGGGADGPIAFDYGMKTIGFGLGIDEAEARYLLGVLSEQDSLEDKIVVA